MGILGQTILFQIRLNLRKNTREFFLRNGYLLIGAAWMITLAFLTNNYWVYYSSPRGVQATLQTSLQSREREFNQLAENGKLMNNLIQQQYNKINLISIQNKEKDFFFFLYNDGWETYWNTNFVNPNIELNSYTEGSYFYRSNECDYELIKRNLGGIYPGQLCIIGLIPIKEKFLKTTKYLPDEYWRKPEIDPNQYRLNRNEKGLPIKTLKGKTLYFIQYKPQQGILHPSIISRLLEIWATISVLIFINLFAVFLSQNIRFWYGFLFLFFVLFLLRLLSYLFPFPFYFQNNGLFDARIYASDIIFKSLGDMLINVLLVVWLILFARDNLKGLTFPKFRNLINFIFSMFFCISLFLVGKFFSDIIKGLVADSKISFDVTNFLNLDRYSVYGFFAVGFLAFCFLFITQTINQFLDQTTNMHREFKYTLLSITGLIWLLFLFGTPDLGYSLILMLWIIIYIMFLDLIDSRNWYGRISFPFVLWLVLLSLTTTSILVYNNHQRELVNRRILAERLAKPNDPDTKTFLGEISQRIDGDTSIENFYRNPVPWTKYQLVQYLQFKYFNGFLSKFDFEVFTFDPEYRPLSNSDTISYSALKNTITLHSAPVTSGLFYQELGYNHYNYIGEKIIPEDSSKSIFGGYLFFQLSPKALKSETILPTLFSTDNFGLLKYSDLYSYAVYDKRQLVFHYNDYPFSIRLNDNDIPSSRFLFRQNKGYSQLWYQTSNNRIVLVIKRSRIFIESITLFEYMFCILLVIAGVYRVMYLLIKARMRWANLKKLINLTIRTRIHGTIIFIVVFSFIILGITTISFFIERYNKDRQEGLSKNINIISLDVNNAFSQAGFNPLSSTKQVLSNNAFLNRLRPLIYNIADIHGVDINLYDPDGNLVISTEQLLYDRGLESEKMNPISYYNLNYKNRIQYIQPESIGRLTYLSAYVPIMGPDAKQIAYLNLPYFASQSDLNQEISNFLITLINLNAFIFLLSGLIALLITNMISNSFLLIGEKLQKINLDQTNEEISWNRKDEIGMLVNEYNKMVKKLSSSAASLAKSEREGAWREMARQVAHEIKNPLTPMKLSLQHLQRAIKENKPNIQELTSNVANTLIEQINHLSSIASDFSAFALISGANQEYFSLNELLNSIVSLFQSDENYLIIFEKTDEELQVMADKTEINRLFTNLLQNAVQSISDGKKGIIQVQLLNELKQAHVLIQDNGTGIPENIKSRIFFPNFTTKTSGTGLGLAMSKNIVEQAKGKIWFETEEGKGTIFHVTFPLVSESELKIKSTDSQND